MSTVEKRACIFFAISGLISHAKLQAEQTETGAGADKITFGELHHYQKSLLSSQPSASSLHFVLLCHMQLHSASDLLTLLSCLVDGKGRYFIILAIFRSTIERLLCCSVHSLVSCKDICDASPQPTGSCWCLSQLCLRSPPTQSCETALSSPH